MKLVTAGLMVLALVAIMTASVVAENYVRTAEIYNEADDVGGWGNVIAGMDIDGDGKTEIYAVNTDWFDQIGLDLIPRIYKYEQDDNGDWQIVWWTTLPMDFQNTWAALDWGDIDQDGKYEVVWGPVNNFGSGLNPNPDRIAIFESVGDGSDGMGIDNGDGTWAPNAAWTITDADEDNLRPFRWYIYDINEDGMDEIVAGCRAGLGIQVYSVSDVPDTGDGSETWATEYAGHLDITMYDIFIMGNTIYGISSGGDVYPVSYDSGFYVEGATITGAVPGGSWKSAAVVDVDGDGTDEVLVVSWDSGFSAVYLLQDDGAGGLTTTMIKDIPDTFWRLYGGSVGDADGDGNTDFVFGTREAAPNAAVILVEYQGGDITDPASWTSDMIDSGVSDATQYDITYMADLNGDGADEILYSGTARGLSNGDTPQPIVILENDPATGIGDLENPLAEGFQLLQNYPNPFNPETRIDYVLPQSTHANLTIYNMLGQKVMTLVDQSQGAGQHTVRWNGIDSQGNVVANGVYIYTLRAGSFVESRKMTFLK